MRVGWEPIVRNSLVALHDSVEKEIEVLDTLTYITVCREIVHPL